MRTLIPILIILALTSCVTQKKCNSKFPPEVRIERHDSLIIKDSIIYKDRYVPYYIKGKTDTIEKLIPVPEKINLAPMRLENTYAYAEAWIENSKLKMKLQLKDQVITFKLDSADKVAKHWERLYHETNQTIIPPPVRYTSKFAKVCIWYSVISIVIIIAYIFFKYFKK
jgi:hypothetical protein